MRLQTNSQTITPEQLIKMDIAIRQAETSDKPAAKVAGLKLKAKREAIMKGRQQNAKTA